MGWGQPCTWGPRKSCHLPCICSPGSPKRELAGGSCPELPPHPTGHKESPRGARPQGRWLQQLLPDPAPVSPSLPPTSAVSLLPDNTGRPESSLPAGLGWGWGGQQGLPEGGLGVGPPEPDGFRDTVQEAHWGGFRASSQGVQPPRPPLREVRSHMWSGLWRLGTQGEMLL